MFRTIASLMLFGTLSSMSPPLTVRSGLPVAAPAVASLPPPLSVSLGGELSASGAIVLDVQSGKELFSRAADLPRPMGSLAKLMTALVILENHDLGEIVTVPQGVQSVGGNVARIQPGERYTVSDMLAALLIASANDAAYALALHHSGDTVLFADAMNDRAVALGLKQTVFENPVGFDGSQQESTPRELGWLALYALKNDVVRSLASQRSATIRDRSGEHTIVLHNTNQLLSSHPSQFFGLKTGTTEEAGQCLIALAYLNGRPYLFVIMRSSDRYRDALTLLNSLTQSRRDLAFGMRNEEL